MLCRGCASFVKQTADIACDKLFRLHSNKYIIDVLGGIKGFDQYFWLFRSQEEKFELDQLPSQ